MSDDPPHPLRITAPCPACERDLTMTWPPDNPESVTLRCRFRDCREEVTIERDEHVIEPVEE